MIKHYKEVEDTLNLNTYVESDLQIDWDTKRIIRNFPFEKEVSNDSFYFQNLRIGIDIDEVLSDFIGGYQDRFGYKPINNWHFTYKMEEQMKELNEDKSFWTGLRSRISHHEIPFIPTCYITRRIFPIEWTKEWIEKNNFPCVEVIHVPGSKVETAKRMELDYFIDDNIKNFQELNSSGIKTFLMDAPHNKQYNVNNHRIVHLADIIQKIENKEI